jgi:hypothetical protein
MTENITWQDFDKMTDAAATLLSRRNYNRIVGLTRGGLTFAVKLSHKLRLPLTPLTWQTRDGERDEEALLDITLLGGRTLFVDDILDSGKTINEIQAIMPEAEFCVLIEKPGKFKTSAVSSIVKLQQDSGWITFPWE